MEDIRQWFPSVGGNWTPKIIWKSFEIMCVWFSDRHWMGKHILLHIRLSQSTSNYSNRRLYGWKRNADMHCVSPSLVIMLLFARNAWSTTKAHITHSNRVLIIIARFTSAKNIREFWRIRFIAHRFWRVHGMPRATPRGCGQRERNGSGTWGSPLRESVGGMSWVSCIHSLLVNLKQKSRN